MAEETIDVERIPVRVGYRNLKYVFYLNMLSMEDEQAYMDRLAAVTPGPDKRDKDYEILVDGLAAWSYQAPAQVDAKGNAVILAIDGESVAETVKRVFGTRTKVFDRILNTAVINFRLAMSPGVDFL